MDTNTFLQTHPVFSLDEATKALESSRDRIHRRMLYFIKRGKVRRLGRGVFATVPPGTDPTTYQPDRYLTMVALRQDALFSHHSALELLGAAHSEWHICTAYTAKQRVPLELGNNELRFLSLPKHLVRAKQTRLGVQSVRRMNKALSITGPERTLIEGFREPNLVGGIEELLESASGFPLLETGLLCDILELYKEKMLWASVGWFLERYRETFFIDESDLVAMEQNIPKSPRYLLTNQRGGTLLPRWNLIVPENFVQQGEPSDYEP